MMDLSIPTAETGFYAGFSKTVAISSKILVSALIVCAISVPDKAAAVLGAMNGFLLKNFASWYIYAAACSPSSASRTCWTPPPES
jgi:hypothetical protein